MENRSLVTIAEHSKEKIMYLLEMAREFEKKPNRRLLAEMGVRDIEISGLCTKCDQERFYSHRGMGEKRGVMAGVIELI